MVEPVAVTALLVTFTLHCCWQRIFNK